MGVLIEEFPNPPLKHKPSTKIIYLPGILIGLNPILGPFANIASVPTGHSSGNRSRTGQLQILVQYPVPRMLSDMVNFALGLGNGRSLGLSEPSLQAQTEQLSHGDWGFHGIIPSES